MTAGEVQQRLARIRDEAARSQQPAAAAAELRQQVLDALIDERVQVTNARESGPKLDEAEVDRAVANVALQNQLTMPQLRAAAAPAKASTTPRFRNNVRDQMLVERVREREVRPRIRISEAEIDALLDERRAAGGAGAELNIAQILVTRARRRERRRSPSAGRAPRRRWRGVRGRRGLRRGRARGLRGRQPRAAAARSACARPTGCRTCSSRRCAACSSGEVAPELLRSGAGFHVLKLVERQRGAATSRCTQTRARHILLRPSAAADRRRPRRRRLAEFKRQIAGGTRTFEHAGARELRGRAAPRRAATSAGSRRAPSCRSSRRR